MSASTLERIASAAIGMAFAIRAFDSKRAWWARFGYGLVGADLLMGAYNAQPLFGLNGPQHTGLTGEPASGVGYAQSTKVNAQPVRAPVPLNFEERKVKTLDQRVKLIHEQLVAGTRDPKIYSLAREVLSRRGPDGRFLVKEKDNRAEAAALFDEVRKRVRYTWDPLDFDAFQTPRKTLELGTADCDDDASLLGALCRSVGIRVRMRVVQTRGNDSWNHIYLVAWVPKAQDSVHDAAYDPTSGETHEWMALDATVAQPAGWEVPQELVIKVKDFDVTDAPGAANQLRLKA